MPFEKKTWVDEDTATDTDPRLGAAELNRIEEGVVESFKKLNNSFGLGTGPDGKLFAQNENGIVLLTSMSLSDAKKSGMFYTGGGVTDKPTSGNNGYVLVLALSDLWVTQTFYTAGTTETYERRCINGVWSGWKLVS